ncbi:DUF2752 domain-containing protein [Nocardioides fonticola]
MTSTAPLRPTSSADSPLRRERMRAPLVTLGSLAAATLALRLRDPHQRGSWGMCPLAAVGVWCPACGGLRAVNDLTHGEVVAAASSNLLFVASIPLILWVLGRWTLARWRGTVTPVPRTLTLWGGVLYGSLALAFFVVRNTPCGSWLAP